MIMGVQDDYNEAWEAGERAGRRDEIERCAMLCTMRGDISRETAKRLRAEGSYTTRAIWPPFKKSTHVHPKWEKNAEWFDLVAKAFDTLARGVRLGWDPRKLEPKTDEVVDLQVFIPCQHCIEPMDCASVQTCEHGVPDRMVTHVRTKTK
jgi:hypothetical protein